MTPQITNEELTAFVEFLEDKNPDAFMNLFNSKDARLWIVEGLKQVINPEYKPLSARVYFCGVRIGESQRDTLEREYKNWNE